MVSVIVPVYNAEHRVRTCVDSLLAQTYKDIEILLVEDGSADTSLRVCEQLANEDSRVKVIAHRKNRGAAAARNSGLDVAQGEYIAFVDSDDYVDPDFLRTLVSTLEDASADMAMCNQYHADGEDVRVNNAFVQYTGEASKYYSRLLAETRPELQVFVWRCLYKRSLIGKRRFVEKALLEDVVFLVQLFTDDTVIATTDTPLYYYVQHQSALTRTKDFSQIILNTVKELEAFTHGESGIVQQHAEMLKYLPLYRHKKRAPFARADRRLVKKLQPDYAQFIPQAWLVRLLETEPSIGVLFDLFVNAR